MPEQKSSKWPLLTTIVILAVITSLTFLFYQFINLPVKTVNATGEIIKDALKPTVIYNNIIYSTLGQIKKENKLVVQTSEINLIIKKSNTKKILWDSFSLGTTEVEMRIPGNKVQYIITPELLSETNFIFDEQKQEIIFKPPLPLVDEEIVEVQTDPEKIEIKKDIGWARFANQSGKYLEDSIKKELKSAIINEAKNDLRLKEAQKNAAEAIKKILEINIKKQNSHYPIQIQ